jgi:hypothetical protein
MSVNEISLSATALNLVVQTDAWRLPAFARETKRLTVQNSPRIAGLRQLPQALTHLFLSNCKSLTQIPRLPDSVQFLRIERCSTLLWLPNLPQGLTHLEIIDCPHVSAPKHMPDSLNHLLVKHCAAFQGARLRIGKLKIQLV